MGLPFNKRKTSAHLRFRQEKRRRLPDPMRTLMLAGMVLGAAALTGGLASLLFFGSASAMIPSLAVDLPSIITPKDALPDDHDQSGLTPNTEAAPKTPLIIAHRGASSTAPENTVKAVRYAINAGSDGVEIDIRSTKDGHQVLMHDVTVDRTTGGSGPVADLDLKSLRGLRVDLHGSSEPIPTLAEALAAVPDPRLTVIDLKNGSDWRKAVAEFGKRSTDSFMLISTNWESLHAIREERPEIRLGLVLADAPQATQLRHLERSGADAAFLNQKTASSDLLATLELAGADVFIWDPMTEEDITRWVGNPLVDGIVTSRPDVAYEIRELREDTAPVEPAGDILMAMGR